MIEVINGIEFTVVESSYLEKYYLNGIKVIRYIARLYDSQGKFVIQGGSTNGRLSALSHARGNLYERYGSYANSRMNYK